MPFKPRLVSPDEPSIATDERAELPADLCALAEQLGTDAEYLAGLYPPPAASAPVAAQSMFSRRLIAVIAGAAALVLCLLGGWNQLHRNSSNSRIVSDDLV